MSGGAGERAPLPWPVGVSEWTFGEAAELPAVLDAVAAAGLDAIELEARPGRPVDEVATHVAASGLAVSSICGTFTDDLDLSHPDAAVRTRGVDYVEEAVGLAVATGAACLIVIPSALGRITPVDDWQAHWARAVAGVREAATRVHDSGVRLVIEPLNMYETDLVTDVAAAEAFVAAVDAPNVGVMVDSFHANLEEPSVDGAFAAADRLWHVHLGDSNRRVPGDGHLDLAPVLAALDARHYRGALVFETLGPGARIGDPASFTQTPAERVPELQAALAWVGAAWAEHLRASG